ncbi:MAG: YybH family protein [Nevskiales bacterium]
MRALRCGLLILLVLAGCATDPPAADVEATSIRSVLAEQAAAWNRGDIDGFMQGYWNSEQLRFASGDSVTYGWAAANQRYHTHYPDRAAMGALEFTGLDVELLAPDAAVVFGHWALQREHDRPHGLFTLVLRKTAEGWKISRDHTSAAD